MSNITELAYCFPASIPAKTTVRVTGVPSLRPGETVEQAVDRRAENFKKIKAQAAAKRAAK